MTRAERVDLQASLCRRFSAAVREHARGECTSQELEDYKALLRGIARRVSEEYCPLHGASAEKRARAYMPDGLGRTLASTLQGAFHLQQFSPVTHSKDYASIVDGVKASELRLPLALSLMGQRKAKKK